MIASSMPFAAPPPRRHTSYPFHEFEPKWQARWEQEHLFEAEPVIGKPKWFIVELPPFANGQLHLGHARNYALADAGARFRRMCGYNVLYTSGFDTFGLPSELAAREEGCAPTEFSERCSDAMALQFVRLGLSHDRRRIGGYHESSYYRWVQWVFLKLLNAGYCMRKKAPSNWCPACAITLADSLVEQGRCWRCRCQVETRFQDQWFIREVDFADELLETLPRLTGWPETVKRIHQDWIGRREGWSFQFKIAGQADLALEVFFETPSLLADVEFVVVVGHHPVFDLLAKAGLLDLPTQRRLAALINSATATSANPVGFVIEHVMLEVPALGRAVPLVASVPAYAAGDAVRPGIPCRVAEDRALAEGLGIAWRATPPAADQDLPALIDGLTAAGAAAPAVRYRLRDWNIARNRYWGPPVPVIHCDACGIVPVAEDALPVVLPLDVDLSGPGNPLETHAAFVHVACPRCGADARRDTETLEAYSSPWWYHWLCKNSKEQYPFSRQDADDWLPVDVMIGGADQTRTCFFHVRMMAKALAKLGVVDYDEPVDTLIAIGFIKRDDKKMSKSGGNAVGIDALIGWYGADALRLGILGAAAPARDFNWSDDLVRRQYAFLTSLWNFVRAVALNWPESTVADAMPAAASDTPLRRRLRAWLDTGAFKITENMVRHDYHLAVKNLTFLFGRLTFFANEIGKPDAAGMEDGAMLRHGVRQLILLLAPLAPHIAEELWSLVKGQGFVSCARWPGALELVAAARRDLPKKRARRPVASQSDERS